MGMKPREIAEQVGCTTQTVSNVCNNPVIQTEVIAPISAGRDAAAKDIVARLQEVAPLAIDLVKKTIETVSDSQDNMADPKMLSVGIRAALGTLDYVVPKQVQGHVVGHVTYEQLQEMKHRMNSANPIPIEAEISNGGD
jgi:predicted transcriptional regulator